MFPWRPRTESPSKIRTLQTASYAQDAILTDKSGSIAGIAGIYNGTLQILPCNGDDIQLAEARFTVQGNKATLVEVLEAGAGSAFEVEGVSVIAANEQGVLFQQDGARIYAFKGEAHDLAVGDVVTVVGQNRVAATVCCSSERAAVSPRPAIRISPSRSLRHSRQRKSKPT
ncbi:MAG: hypothetical protein ACLUQ6_06040 [Alistipes onderdonkii]